MGFFLISLRNQIESKTSSFFITFVVLCWALNVISLSARVLRDCFNWKRHSPALLIEGGTKRERESGWGRRLGSVTHEGSANYANAVNECGRGLPLTYLSVYNFMQRTQLQALRHCGAAGLRGCGGSCQAGVICACAARSCLEKVVFAQFANDVFLSTSTADDGDGDGGSERLTEKWARKTWKTEKTEEKS